jgi:tetratricopeptide (TPR) repeat protein
MGENTQNEDDFPGFSEEQLNEIMKRQNFGASAAPQQKTLPELIAQMEVSLAQFPDDTTMAYDLAKLTYEQYQADSSEQWLQKAVNYYNKVLDLDANYEQGRPYYNRMLARLAQKNYEAALKDLNAFVRVNQNQIPINHQAMRAEILFQQGQLSAACAVYQEAKLIAERDSLPTGQEALWAERCP